MYKEKKVVVTTYVEKEILDQINKKKEVTGITATRIINDALRDYFKKEENK